MQITVKSIVDGDVRSVIIEFDRGDMVRSLIVAFCNRIGESLRLKKTCSGTAVFCLLKYFKLFI